VYYFDGKASAIHIPTAKVDPKFATQFTLSTWMKHGGNEDFVMTSDKEYILCLADGEGTAYCLIIIILLEEVYKNTFRIVSY